MAGQGRSARGADGVHAPSARARQILDAERADGVTTIRGFAEFAARARAIGDELRHHLRDAHARGARVVGYGAGSKAALLLGASGIDATLLPVTADMAPGKQGRRIPGTDIAIVSPTELVAGNPDEVVILLWDLADEVVRQLRDAGLTSTRFIVPAPRLRAI